MGLHNQLALKGRRLMSTQPGDAHWLRRAPLRPAQTPCPGSQGGIKKTVETSKTGSVVRERVPSPFSAAMSGFPTAAPPVCAAPNCWPTNSAEGNRLASSVIERCKHLHHLIHEAWRSDADCSDRPGAMDAAAASNH